MSTDTPIEETLPDPLEGVEGGARVMPFDRSGGTGITRQQKRAEDRRQAKVAQQEITRQIEMKKMFKQPVPRGEFQNTVYNLLGGIEKMSAEFKKLTLRTEALIRASIATGVLTAEEFDRQFDAQNQFNSFVDSVTDRYAPKPVDQVIQQVRDYNSNPLNEIKVQWQHIDLAPRLRQDQNLTLEEKLMIAAEFEMPEPFIQGLRDLETAGLVDDGPGPQPTDPEAPEVHKKGTSGPIPPPIEDPAPPVPEDS